MKNKRCDQCLFCNRTRCNSRVVCDEYGYDEVACNFHKQELYAHADKTLPPGINRRHITSSGREKREVPRMRIHINAYVDIRPVMPHELEKLLVKYGWQLKGETKYGKTYYKTDNDHSFNCVVPAQYNDHVSYAECVRLVAKMISSLSSKPITAILKELTDGPVVLKELEDN